LLVKLKDAVLATADHQDRQANLAETVVTASTE
jgi:hypothetical protein